MCMVWDLLSDPALLEEGKGSVWKFVGMCTAVGS